MIRRTSLSLLSFALALGALAVPETAHAQSVYSFAQSAGTTLTRRRVLNFTGAGVSAADNAANKTTDVTISGAPAGAAGGALAGTYPNPTIASAAAIASPTLSGTATGTYSLGGTPTLAAGLSIGTGLGAIVHLLGPTDQTLKLSAGTPAAAGGGQGFTLLAGAGNGANVGGNLTLSAGLAGLAANAGGSIVFQSALAGAGTTAQTLATWANTGALSWASGLGAITHLTGPSDQTFALAAGAARGFTLTGNLASTVSTTAGSLGVDATTALNLGTTNATSLSLGNATHTLGLTVQAEAATAGAGWRNTTTRQVVRASTVAVPDCSGAGLTLTVSQFLEAGAATCSTAQTITLPSWQGAGGIVQALPGTPAVGDEVDFLIDASAAFALTLACGTGGTCARSTTIPANTSALVRCKVTAVSSGTETATCY